MRSLNFISKLSFLIIFHIVANSSYSQRLDSLLYEQGSKYPQEKIYIQYDRPYYNPGETIWFKAYLATGNPAAGISKIVYAELINEKGIVLQKKIMPVIESGASSFFDLPDTISNTVFVRAYTAWMLNFDAALLYTKPISIITNTKKPAPVNSLFLNFFPEGGDLIGSVESLIAFKATDQTGNPVAVSGNIEDKKGTRLTNFTSVHNGMGTFAFTPVAGEEYKATWKDKKGVAHVTALPIAKKQGVVLSVINTANQLLYTLKRSDSAKSSFTSFFIIAQMNQQVVYSARINMVTKKEVTASIPTDSLATGVMQLSIFNADEIPVAERVVFINRNNYYFNTDLHAMELNLNKRKHNVLQVDVGGSILSNLSISVTDESLSTAPSNRDNIYSNLLLCSDLKGYIYNPAYYFSSDEDSVGQQLDLVMLTNGWRRFKWEDIIADKWPVIKHQPENYISILGTVYGPTASMLRGKEVTGILKTKSSDDIFTMPVSQDGKFAVTGAAFFDTARLYYQFNQDRDKTLTSSATFSFKVNFANAEKPAVSLLSSLYQPVLPDTTMAIQNKKLTKLKEEELSQINKVKSLDVVTLTSRIKTREQKQDEKYTSGFFTGGDAYIFSVEDDPTSIGAPTILSYLQAKVAGLTISVGPVTKATWRGSATSFFLNESSTDISRIQDIPMSDVALIKVFRPIFFSSAGGGAGGAVAVYLKKDAENTSSFTGLEFVRLNGYSSVKEFYSPDYEKPEITPATDFRSTLYWNPTLIMDKTTRRIKIPFYNNDNCKKIRVIIEGINEEGQLTHEEKVFE